MFTKENVINNIPESFLGDRMHRPYSNMMRIGGYLQGIALPKRIGSQFYGNLYPGRTVLEQIDRDYKAALRNSSFLNGTDIFSFSTSLTTPDGKSIIASVKPENLSSPEGSWFLNFVGIEAKSQIVLLEKKCDMSTSPVYAELAEMAKEESWGDNYEILRSYLNYTFLVLEKQGLVQFNADAKIATFHTGLRSKQNKPIFFCMFCVAGQNDSYRYAGVCTEGDGYLGEVLCKCFPTLPEPAAFFMNSTDMFFDATCELRLDCEHIIRRLYRLPFALLEQTLGSDIEAAFYLEQIKCKTMLAEQRKMYARLSNYVLDTPELSHALKSKLELVVDKALCKLRESCRLVVPCYHPQSDSVNYLMPLNFFDDGTAQAALIISREPKVGCVGKTILTLAQAYCDARLLGTQADWMYACNSNQGDRHASDA